MQGHRIQRRIQGGDGAEDVAAATLVFEDRPELVALFKSTLPSSKRRSTKAKKTEPDSE